MSKAVIATMMHKLQGTHRYTDIANEVNVSVTTVIRTSTKTGTQNLKKNLEISAKMCL